MDGDTKSWLLSELVRRTQYQKEPLFPNSSFDLTRLETQEYTGVFEALNDWSFDIFRVEKVSPGDVLSSVTYKVIAAYGLIDVLNLDTSKLMKSLARIEKGYKNSNPYHNSTHAADIVQSMSVLLSSPLLIKNLSPLEKLSAILAAAIHDYGHPGVNNNFLIKTRDPLAALYNDQSPLENHHLTASLGIIFQEDLNVFSHLSRESQDQARRLMIELVLATDIGRHFALLSTFNAKSSAGNLNLGKPDDLSLLLQMVLKCADISNPGKPLPLYLQWVDRITEEFFSQGDRERALGLSISPFMDRHAPKIPKSQINFIEFLCAPVFLSVGGQLDRLDILEQTQDNLRHWKNHEL